MKRFVFGLETLRRIRTQKRREAEAELGRASALCERIASTMKSTQDEITQGPQSREPKWAFQEQAYLNRLKSRLEQLASELLDARRLEAIWRQNLSVAQRDEEIIENLREAQWGRWRKEMLKAEQKVLDDLANRRPQKKTFSA